MEAKECQVNKLPVMKSFCKTCPFRPIGKNTVLNRALADEVTSRTLFNSQQICHGTEGKNREPRNRCYGSFETNSDIYKSFGLDKEAFRSGEIKLKK